MRGMWFGLAVVLSLGLAQAAAAAEPADADEQLLRAAKIGTDGPALLDFFRKHTRGGADRERVQALVRQLGDDVFEVREKASAGLVALGPAAVPVLRQALKDRDPEVANRARQCLERITNKKGPDSPLLASAARLLAVRRPAGAVEVLLAYLPSSEDERATEAIQEALAALAVRDGKPDPALLTALGDRDPARRAVAAEVAGRAGLAEARPALQKLLQDPDPPVRLAAARTLLGQQEAAAVPVLIALVGELPLGEARLADDSLRGLAGPLGPAVPWEENDAARQRCRTAWADWWRSVEGPVLLQALSKQATPDAVAATVRLVALHRPPGAVEALLTHADSVQDEAVREQLHEALAALAGQGGEAVKALGAALTATSAPRRAAAAEALVRAGVVEQRPGVRKLLQDPEPDVRLHAALPLASSGEKDAVPVLIALLSELPQQKALQAEDLLVRLADGAPPAVVGKDEASRGKAREAWAAWWREHEAKADLSRLERAPRLLGLSLVVLLDHGRAQEMDPDGKVRWAVDGLLLPLDVQLLPGDRLLIAEHQGNRVTERNLKGDILWQRNVDKPVMAQRLPNGHTFIATQLGLLEVDAEGREVFTFGWPTEYVMRARRLPGGEVGCVTQAQRFVRLDRQGRELFSFPVNVQTSGGRIEVLPGGRVLVPEGGVGRVVEYDVRGKVVWEAAVEAPVAAVRLANGNTLVTSMPQPLTQNSRAVELDRAGKEVWQFRPGTKVTRAFRR